MTRLALLTEIPAPFRIPLFNALAREEGLTTRVLFLAERDPRRPHYELHAGEARFDSRVLPGRELRARGRWIVLSRGVLAELHRFRPDALLVGGWNQPAFWQALLYARLTGTPLHLWVESTARDARSGAGPLEAAKRGILRSAAGFVVPGRASAEYLEALGVDPGRIAVAPNAVDPAVFGRALDRARAREQLGLDRCTFLYVGRLDPEKGLDTLLAAAAGLDADVALVGGGAEEARLRAAAPANVRFVGPLGRDRLPPWYAAADAFVLPSRSEQWGMVLNEAAAAGLPLVATEAAGAAHELVEECFRVPAGDVAALRAALARLASDPGLRERAGRRSLELAGAFTPERWAAAVAGVVRRVG